MAIPKSGEFSVRITVVGHASARWKGANSVAEAARLNQALSEQRARNVQRVVEQILKRELPTVNIAVGLKGVGSQFPAEPERPQDNEAINRSVVVRVELSHTLPGEKVVARPPMRIDARSRFWYVRVTHLQSAALGLGAGRVNLVLRNAISKKETTFGAWIGGGGIAANPGDWFAKQKPDAQVGKELFFETDEAMGFDEFKGQLIRIGSVAAKLGIGASYTYLAFAFLGDGAKFLPFDHGFKVGKPSLQASVMTGWLEMTGKIPGDWWEVDSLPDIIPIEYKSKYADGVVLSFPTGQANLSDLTAKDRQRLEDFVTNEARNIGVLLERNIKLSAARP
jgi:hypothetical protein